MGGALSIVNTALACIIVLNCIFYLVLHLFYKNFRITPGWMIAWEIFAVMINFITFIYLELKNYHDSPWTHFECHFEFSVYIWAQSI